MANAWLEVSQVESDNRRELVLNGQEISNRLEERGIDERIFELTLLNYLEISSTKLSIVPDGIGKLSSLTKLVLCNNALEELTPEVGKLTSLKLLNVSNNKLKSVPVEIQNLTELDTLNLSINQLQVIPNLSSLTNLHVINISNNQIESLPDGIFDSSLVHLSQIIASDNNISCVDSTVDALPHLNLLDLTNNKLTEVPSTLSLCPKLKELKLIGNKFTDRRFGKMVQESKTKSVIEYLHNIWKKESKTSDGNSKDKKKRKKGKKTAVETEVVRNQLSVLRITSDSNVVTVTPAVLSVRQYIICCIVRHLDLSSKFKSFITLQTKLHDTICENRQAGTVATHDLNSVRFPLTYDAQFPQLLQIVPLFQQKEVSGEKLFEDLRLKAEELRKEKKRNTYSGIHKYLKLIEGKTQYPCVVDRDGKVISFPPITNSDKTKISKTTTDILVEVTSTTSLDTCKKILEELLYRMLDLGLGRPGGGVAAASSGSDSDSAGAGEGTAAGADTGGRECLVVEQVKIVDSNGDLKVLYPSRTDLNSELIEVIRNYE